MSKTTVANKKPSLRKDNTFKGEALKNRIKTTKVKNGSQTIELASIKKENLGIEKYQRPLDKKRADKIAEEFHPDFAVINVCETEYDGEYYYTITDGQHRSEGQPEDSMACIVTNSVTAARQFIISNDPRTTKAVSTDEFFWASHYDKDPNCVFIVNFLKKEWGVNPVRCTADNIKNKEFCSVGTLYIMLKQISKEIERSKDTKELDDKSKAVIAKDRFEKLCHVLFIAYGPEEFYAQAANRYTGYPSLWKATKRFLSIKGWDNYELLADALSNGFYSKNGKGSSKNVAVDTPQMLLATARSDYSNNGNTEANFHVIDSIWKHANR
jgi:hypothetical protein